jgi:SAM-dependent methyltransferase
MDLRPLITSTRQIEAARRLAFRGLLTYQPYIFSDDFAVGSGPSLFAGYTQDAPSIWCPDAGVNDADPVFRARELAKENRRDAFFSANAAMRSFYDGMVDQIANALGPLNEFSVLDVGCNTGYFPLAFARMGARKATGIDRIDYTDSVDLLNEICGTSVEFATWNYDGSLSAIRQYDLVLSMAVVCHLSEPLRHLAWLGSSARKALLVFTACDDIPDYRIKYHTVNRYYSDDRFPHCFDVTSLSRPLLRLAFKKMGFSRIVDITAARSTMPPGWADKHLCLLGVREYPTSDGPAAATWQDDVLKVVPTDVIPGSEVWRCLRSH